MGCKLDDFTIDAVFKDDELTIDSFNFLEYSGRKALYSQGIYGQDVVVAVLDTGVSPHMEFGNRLLPGFNAIKNYGNSKSTDDNCHGTHVAGSIAGATCGIAPQCEVLPVKVLRSDGSGEWSDIIRGLDYARTWNKNGKKVKIISMSLSGGERDITLTEKDNLETAINKCVKSGIAVIVSMGNTSENEKRYPACFDAVIAVTALDQDKEFASYSTYGSHADVSQIGTKIISTYYEGQYLQLSGTSMSTPIVSGIAALLACEYKAKYKEDIPENTLWNAIRHSTKDLGREGIDSKFGVGFCTLQPLNMTIETEYNSDIVKFNGKKINLDVPVQIINGRTMFPIREFAERTGAAITWEAENEYHKTRAKFSW